MNLSFYSFEILVPDSSMIESICVNELSCISFFNDYESTSSLSFQVLHCVQITSRQDFILETYILDHAIPKVLDCMRIVMHFKSRILNPFLDLVPEDFIALLSSIDYLVLDYEKFCERKRLLINLQVTCL